jgi:hypothetical protein
MDFMGRHFMPRPLYERMYGRLLYGALDADNRG